MSRILLVDDDPDIVETLRYSLEHEGFAVDVVRDGLAALHAARQNPPDLAILDVMLPGANGYEVSRYLRDDMHRRRLPAFKILMLTARRVHSAARQDFLATWSGADACIWKPFDHHLLVHEVRRLLAAAPVGADKGARA
jgi:two-component system phosphate regulon response regulator PhoB